MGEIRGREIFDFVSADSLGLVKIKGHLFVVPVIGIWVINQDW